MACPRASASRSPTPNCVQSASLVTMPCHDRMSRCGIPDCVVPIAGWLPSLKALPAFQAPPFAPDADTKVSITKIKIPCNWSQIQEGQIDSAHSSTLHSSDMVPARVESAGASNTHWTRPSTDKSPRIFTQRTPYGFRYVAVRRPIKNARTSDYLRITVYVAPFISLIPPNDSYNVCSINVPVDDNNTWFYFVAWGDENCIDADEWRAFNHAVVGKDLNADYSTKRTLENDFMQDRDAMAAGKASLQPCCCRQGPEC